MNDDITKILDDIANFRKENENVFIELKRKVEEADHLIFRKTCLKPQLDRCEPEYCTYRINNECKYPGFYSQLNKLTQI